ncbi:signal peptide peptidase-domain-containing protein [Mycena amicta]|nr:signal peptide peptidase-domain-containing protein [Mycena amicta]
MDVDLYFSYAGLLALATSCVYFGAFGSLPSPRNPDGSRAALDIPERLDCIGCAHSLCSGLYVVVKYFGPEWINLLLGWYFAAAGVACGLEGATIGIARWALGDIQWHAYPEFSLDARMGEQVLLQVSMNSISLWLLPLAAVPSAVYMLNGRSALLTGNVLGVSFASSAIGSGLLKIDSFRTGVILLSGLFLYDIWWVFGTEVMVKVATSVDVPIKLLWPKSVVFGTQRGFTMLGLGDIVVPGVFVALALRYDHFRAGAPSHTRFGRPYFNATLSAYVLGLITTMTVMHVFKAAQPALLYLSPACIGAFVVVSGVVRRELGAAWAWSDVDEDPPKTKAE